MKEDIGRVYVALMKVKQRISIAAIVVFFALVQTAKADICVGETLDVSQVVGRLVAIWRKGEQGQTGALVELKEFRHNEWKTKLKTITDENGRFLFTNVRSGTYEVVFTPEALSSHTVLIRLKKSRSAATQEIVVTTGTGVHFCPSAELRPMSSALRNHAEHIVGLRQQTWMEARR